MGQEAVMQADHEALKTEVATIRQAVAYLIGELCKCPETKGAVAAARFHLQELHAIQNKAAGKDGQEKPDCAVRKHTVELLFDTAKP